MPQPDTDADLIRTDLQLHDSPAMRVLFLIAGSTCVALGVAGLFLPVMSWAPALMGTGLAIWLYRIPFRDRPA